ncbi:hypothetical protein TNCV_2879781 [Trichonephila clavipes]|uniref:F-box domain-containing protein n=1 Tax=Trichonephila clavipes TaxID=2585209 RepID=A0A8X6W245_TRICX|nr:hypothetical protein TNCV_2879781 [Trichonephila clavipes]
MMDTLGEERLCRLLNQFSTTARISLSSSCRPFRAFWSGPKLWYPHGEKSGLLGDVQEPPSGIAVTMFGSPQPHEDEYYHARG